jgi:PAS domain S-box-containing protein
MPSSHVPADGANDLLQAIIEQAPDAIIYADGDGAIRVWNRAAQQIFGYAAAEVLGKSLDVIIPERFRGAHWEGFRQALKNGRVKHAGRVMTTRSVHKNGSKLYVDLSFGLVQDGEGRIMGALAIGRDSTARQLSGAATPGAAAPGAAEPPR